MRRSPHGRGWPSALVAGLILLQPAVAATGTGPALGKPVPGSFFVSLTDPSARGPLRAWLRAVGAEVRHEYRSLPGRLNIRHLAPGLEAALAHLPGVAKVTPDVEVRAQLIESIPAIGAQATNPELESTDGGLGIAVCVVDTGMNRLHSLFDDDNNPETPTGRVSAWKDFRTEETNAYDDNGHGSHVCGIIFGRYGLAPGGNPLQGVAPRARIYVAKVLDAGGFGLASDVAAGIEWCAGLAVDSPPEPADIINLSLGFGRFTQVCDTTDATGVAAAANAAAEQGILVVAAAGNEATINATISPACASGAMAVGAVYDANVGPRNFPICSDPATSLDRLTCFSSRWDHLDVVAPGCVTHSAHILGPSILVPLCGTSMSAAHVSGLAALVKGANRSLTGGQIRERIRSGAKDLGKPGFDRAHGFGRIQAIPAVVGPTCVPSETPEASCADGADNDCDGIPDCLDSDCCGDAACSAEDADGDGFAACDCAPGDPSLWTPPGEVRKLLLTQDVAAGGTTLTWSPPSQTGAGSLRYDTLRAATPRGFHNAGTCLESDDGQDTTAADPAAPASGGVFFYQVRAENGCAGGVGLGGDSDGVARLGRSCP